MNKLFKLHFVFLVIAMSFSFASSGLEGQSEYFANSDIQDYVNSRSQSYLIDLEELDLSGASCEFDYLRSIRKIYRQHGHSEEEETLKALKYLRSIAKIDDSQYRLISKSIESFDENLKYKFKAPLYKSIKDFNAKAFTNYAQGVESKLCYTDIFKKLVSELGESKSSKIKAQIKTAYHRKMIDRKNYWMLKRLVQSDYYKEPQTLSKYLGTQRFLNKQFPARNEIAQSDYISSRADKDKLSRRELLLSRYNQFQIIYMREMIEKLLNRLNADEVRISVVLDDYVMETIILDPMEQYRFAAKMIRKELGDLQNKSLFSKTQVSFSDLITASFETGLVPGDDLEALALVEEVWNPALTKAEKRKKFIKRYGTIFVAALPTSVYFVKVLSLVGIEMLTEVKEEPSRDHSLF